MFSVVIIAVDKSGVASIYALWMRDQAPSEQAISDAVWEAEEDGYECQVLRGERDEDPEVELFNREN